MNINNLQISYGIDSIFSWQNNKKSNEDNGLVLNFGYHTTHVSPILNGKLLLNKTRRMNLGGYEMIWYIYRLLQMKYPAHLNAITWTRVEEIFHRHSTVALDYRDELAKWENLDYYNETVKKIQLPYIQPQVVNTVLTEEKIKRRKEITKRLIEANQKRLQKKAEEVIRVQLINFMAYEHLFNRHQVPILRPHLLVVRQNINHQKMCH